MQFSENSKSVNRMKHLKKSIKREYKSENQDGNQDKKKYKQKTDLLVKNKRSVWISKYKDLKIKKII